MGHYMRSPLRCQVTPETVEALIHTIVKDLWGDTVRVTRVEGIPVQAGDTRVAKWCFWPPGWEADAAFSLALIQPGRTLEFKLPQWSDPIEMQRALRARLVRRLNAMGA